MKKGILILLLLFAMTVVSASSGAGKDLSRIGTDTAGTAKAESDTTETETTETETTETDTAEPGTTGPDTTEPGTTEPEPTVPDTTEPEPTVPDTTEEETTAPKETTKPKETTGPKETDGPAESSAATEPAEPFKALPTDIRHIIKDVPYICQYPDYPNGCEAVSTVIALRYLGMELSADTFIDDYLDRGSPPNVVTHKGPDPYQVYCGDPRSASGWGCYNTVIKNALDKFLDPGRFRSEVHTGDSVASLCSRYIDNDIPVVFWASIKMVTGSASKGIATWVTPEGKTIDYFRSQHCLVLVGYSDSYYYFIDPTLNGTYEGHITRYKRSATEKAYAAVGSQSVVIYPADKLL